MIEYTNKITALYSRLSVGDEDRDGGESNSIVNQKAFLERYARQHKLMNIRHYIDDDESGRFFDRSAYTQMISDVESGKIGIVIMKDMTRWGRDYLQVGNAMEIFRRNNVRFIAINNGIDSKDQNTLEFAPFINIMSEWYARDMAEKQSSRDRLKEITASIEDGIKELFQSETYAQYLQTMSRFHHYSVNNQVLIHMQKPDATLVAGFNKWKNQFGRNVIKGEHGIKIIAPTPFKKKIEQEKLDPDTQLPMLDEDGKIITEEKTIQIPMYKPVTVFDVSQTEGKPLPQLAHDLSGNVANYDVFMEALRRSSPVPISIEVMRGGMDGYFDLEHQDIAINMMSLPSRSAIASRFTLCNSFSTKMLA